MKRITAFLIVISMIVGYSQKSYALGECGLSCCIGGAMASGATLAQNFGLSLQYENMYMETIRDGKDSISPDTILDDKRSSLSDGQSFSVPTEMKMQKLSLLATYPVTERLQLLGIVPFVKNEMDMRKVTRMGMMYMNMDMTMDKINELGDITLMGLYTLYQDAPVRPTQRLTIGLGLKTPTGKNNIKTASGNYVHGMMQPGTGSWDPLFLVNYMRAFYPLILQTNFMYHLSTEGDEGYEFGDQVSLDMMARYQAANFMNIGLEINGIYAGKDEDHDNKYARPSASLIDNTDNTGIKAVYISPNIQFKIPNTPASIDIKFQKPVYQDVRGIQQVVDWRWLASASFAF